ncbi:hypothetical protein ACFFX0_19265 [Citricoccus parietis]|uniref:Uncharacterized protein n=1 Tax=Citricoccus parietis TaxID=592307 RepID=A0ABV5G3J2_9MICC
MEPPTAPSGRRLRLCDVRGQIILHCQTPSLWSITVASRCGGQ